MTDLFRGRTTLITGASSGIGAAFADRLAGLGSHLILTARDETRLGTVADHARAQGVTVTTIATDLAEAGAPGRLVQEVHRAGLRVDHLVNNAGSATHGRSWEVPVADQLAVIDLNARAATELALGLLPAMVARGSGGILNVGSTSAFQGLAWIAVYAASKAYLLTWSEALWVELRGSGVRCCCVCPGPVDTPFFQRNRLTAAPPQALRQEVSGVVRVALRAYRRDKSHAITSGLARAGAWATRLFPRTLSARVGARYAQPRTRSSP